MDEQKFLAERFEANRPHLRRVAYRMLGSAAEAEDAVQEAWLRLSRSDTGGVDNLGGWLTTVTARICLDMLRSRKIRREEALDESPMRRPTKRQAASSPSRRRLLADSVGLGDARRAAGADAGRARGLRAARHVRHFLRRDRLGRRPHAGGDPAAREPGPPPGPGSARGSRGRARPPAQRRRCLSCGLARRRLRGASLTLLDPEVVVRADATAVRLGNSTELRGAPAVAQFFKGKAALARAALVDGTAGIVVAPMGRLLLVLMPTIVDGRIVAIDVVADPRRLATFDVATG